MDRPENIDFLPNIEELLLARAVAKVQDSEEDHKDSFDSLGEQALNEKKPRANGVLKRVIRGNKVVKKVFSRNAGEATANSGRTNAQRKIEGMKASRKAKKRSGAKINKANIKRARSNRKRA